MRFPSRGSVSGYWGRLSATVSLLLLVALNAQVSALPLRHNSLSEPSRPIVYAIDIKQVAPLPETPLQPVEPLQTIYVSPLRVYGTYANNYAPGNCTYYVASRLPVPNSWGNANAWAYAAALAGYKVSSTPVAGSVAQTTGDSWLGHVAVVESVNPDGSFVISEMNAQGLGVIDSRTTTVGEFQSFILF